MDKMMFIMGLITTTILVIQFIMQIHKPLKTKIMSINWESSKHIIKLFVTTIYLNLASWALAFLSIWTYHKIVKTDFKPDAMVLFLPFIVFYIIGFLVMDMRFDSGVKIKHSTKKN